MEKTTEHEEGIIALISLLQEKYPTIITGGYLEHYIGEKNDYAVVLDNNTVIKIHKHVASDAITAPYSISNETLGQIINTIKSI